MRALRPALSVTLLFAAACSAPPVETASWALDDTPYDRSAYRFGQDADEQLAEVARLRQAIVSVRGPRTIGNTLVPYNALDMHLDAISNDAQLYEEVHPDASVRDAAAEVSQRVSAVSTQLSLDQELYAALSAVDVSDADAATRWAVEKILRSYRRAGVDRPADVRGRLEALDAELVQLGQDFDANIRGDVRSVTVDSAARLAGLPADFLASRPADDEGRITITTNTPDYQPVMTYGTDVPLRRELYIARQTRAYPANMEVFGQLLDKRAEKARLLGYANWADYITEDKMIGSAADAASFIDRISTMARPHSARDYDRLLALKRQGQPGAQDVAAFESGLYSHRLKTEEYGFDAQELRPYLEFTRVRQGILDLSERLFDIRITPVAGLRVWHEDVTAYDVADADGTPIGRFFLDLHPRKDKYGHAACFPIRSGVKGLRLPQAALVCNFPDPAQAEDGVALMEYSQVQTFFHEFGHLLHCLLGGRQQWMTNSGFNVEWDFVEAPSQMLEEFLLDPEVLQSFAIHHETGEPVPDELIERLERSNGFGKGLGTTGQMFYAAVSLQSHLRDPAGLDTDALVAELQAEHSAFAQVPDTHMQCSFGHLNGYSAIYYTYMWSKVIAKDLFSRFEEEGVLSPGVARDYRRDVLEAGGSKPADELVRDFLGRERSFAAYERWLGED